MFRFTIRDVLWLTVVVALGIVVLRERATLKAQSELWDSERDTLLLKWGEDATAQRKKVEMLSRQIEQVEAAVATQRASPPP